MVQVTQETTFAQLLKQLRDVYRVSQSKLAESSGFDHSYVSRLESGQRTPTREAVIKFADALGVSPSERDSLLAAAGFLPQRVESLLADEPVLTEAFQLLRRDDIPEEIRSNVRQMIGLVVSQARLAITGQPSGPGTSPGALAAD